MSAHLARPAIGQRSFQRPLIQGQVVHGRISGLSVTDSVDRRMGTLDGSRTGHGPILGRAKPRDASRPTLGEFCSDLDF